MPYIEIVLRSDLCAGSGESSGNAIDQDICVNAFGLPYIPARRLKGCLREAGEELVSMGYPGADEALLDRLFGNAYGIPGAFTVDDAKISGADEMSRWLEKARNDPNRPAAVRKMAQPMNVVTAYTTVRGQTRLEHGVKVDNTLRFTRVLSHYDPFSLDGSSELKFTATVHMNSEEDTEFLKACALATRHIGLHRNRGLGNVSVVFHEENDDHAADPAPESDAKGDVRIISFCVSLDSDITLPGCRDMNSCIPARSVIGCMAAEYLKHHKVDEDFTRLFLDGTVKWSPLTPVIRGEISHPAPLYLVKLKNGEGRLVNTFAEEGNAWKRLKPKSLDGSYCVLSEGVSYISIPETRTQYHYSVNRKELYMQESVASGIIYGGTVEVSAELSPLVLELISRAEFRFGRSKAAQYSACSLYGTPAEKDLIIKENRTDAGEAVYVVLESDMILSENGRYITEPDEVRQIIAGGLDLVDQMPDGRMDHCSYYTVGGFNTMWNLQKMQIPAIRGGSVYCFVSDGKKLPDRIALGEYLQEGFGQVRIIPDRQMRKETEVRNALIDTVHGHGGSAAADKLETALIVMAGKNVLKAYARSLAQTASPLPVSRLRRMTEDASDFEELLEKVEQIKTSDISSDKMKSRKEESLLFLKNMFGGEHVDLKKMLASEDAELVDAVMKNSEAARLLKDHWKQPLLQYLHRAHYDRKDKEKEKA